MRISFHTVGLNNTPLREIIRRVGEAGYAGIELGCEDIPWAPPAILPGLPADELAELVALCRASNLAVSAIGGHIPMVSADPMVRRQAIDFVNGCTDLAVAFGAPVNHILSGQLPEGLSRSDGWRQFCDAVAETTDYAKSHGIELGIEGVFANLFRQVEDYRQLTRDLPDTPWKVNCDLSHLVVHGEDPYRLIEEFGDRIAHVHVKDGDGLYPDFTFPPLGKGKLDFDRVFDLLRAAGYQGWTSVEYEAQAFGWQDPEDIRLKAGLDFCRRHVAPA